VSDDNLVDGHFDTRAVADAAAARAAGLWVMPAAGA
jgi:hypothetical protein